MDLESFVVAVFCALDDGLPTELGGRRLRQRGPAPVLADSEVLTMEVVGEFLGLEQDTAIFRYFRRHWVHFFPRLERVDRSTFVRQAANLWAVKERLWRCALAAVPHDDLFAVVDSFPIPVCRFARAYRCRRFRGEAGFGKDLVARQTFYGFRLHVRLCWPGVLARCCLAPANVAETAVLPHLLDGTEGLAVGDRNYGGARTAAEAARVGVALLAPSRSAAKDPSPKRSALLSRVRYRIDTVFGQLAERLHVKRVWAQDPWQLWSRLLRKLLTHTLAVLLNTQAGTPHLQLARLVA
jgi:hypothetical protein